MGSFKWVLPITYYRENFDAARCCLGDRSWLLSAPHHFDEKTVIMPQCGERPQDRVCAIPRPCPGDAGTFGIEVGLELSDVLPLPESMELWVSLCLRGQAREVCLSNQMLKVFLCVGQRVRRESVFALSPRDGLESFLDTWSAAFGQEPHSFLAEPASTIVTARHEVQAHDAETALCIFLNRHLSDFLESINSLLSCYREAEPAAATHVRPYYDTAMFPYGYVLIKGADTDKIRPELVQLNYLRMLPMRAVTLDEPRMQRLRELAVSCEEIPVYRQLLGEARSLQSSGFNQEALLRSVFAAEACVSAFVQQRLLAERVSRKKLEDSSKDMSFSRMLNIDLFALCPAEDKPDPHLVGRVNRARGIRNDLAHGKNVQVPDEDAKDAVESIRALVAFIEAVARKMSIALTSVT